MRFRVFIPLFYMVIFCCGISNADVIKLLIKDSGIYRPEVVPTKDEMRKDGAGGDIAYNTGAVPVEETDRIPCSLGVSFGYRFTVESIPREKPVKFQLVINHPDMENPGLKGKIVRQSGADILVWPGVLNYVGWSFNQPWEVVPGKYKIELIREGRVFAERSFDVYAPEKQEKGEK